MKLHLVCICGVGGQDRGGGVGLVKGGVERGSSIQH